METLQGETTTTEVVENEVEVGNPPQQQLSEKEIVEQEAIARYKESQKTQEEIANEVPEGYNEDGTPQEELIAGKFKSQDDLVKAYEELQKKLGQKEEPKQEAETTTTEDTIETPSGETINVDKFSKEFADNGSLSEDSYKELSKYGFTKDDVDRYIQGQVALGNQYTQAVYNTVGGEAEYTEVITWASENMDADVINEYNDSLQKQDQKTTLRLLEYMAMKKASSQPTQPRRLEGTATLDAGGIKPFSDKNEWQKAATNRLYGKDLKYTAMVDKRYLASRKNGII
jgi:hypothetical protein